MRAEQVLNQTGHNLNTSLLAVISPDVLGSADRPLFEPIYRFDAARMLQYLTAVSDAVRGRCSSTDFVCSARHGEQMVMRPESDSPLMEVRATSSSSHRGQVSRVTVTSPEGMSWGGLTEWR